MDDVQLWFQKLLLKIKILTVIYFIILLACLIYAVVIWFIDKGVSITSNATLLDNIGIYVLQDSFFQKFENLLFFNIQSILSAMRKAIVFNNTFRALTILVAVLAVVLMGFTMLIGDQKITIKEFFMDILLIFGSASILLYYDPALSVNPNAEVQPEKYITLLYNFLQSISDFISKMLFGTVEGFMKIEYKDNTKVGYYAPIDVIASMFFDPKISYIFKMKLASLIFSPMFILVPLLLIILLYYLVPCVLSVFMAILLAKATIMFSIQFLPFFILFSSINDVKIKINKKARGMGLPMKLITEGIAQPMLFLALTSFLAGLLFYVFIITKIEGIFNFSTASNSSEVETMMKEEKCAVFKVCKKRCDIRIFGPRKLTPTFSDWLNTDPGDSMGILDVSKIGYDPLNPTTLADAQKCLDTKNWTDYDCIELPQMCEYKCPVRIFRPLLQGGGSMGILDNQIGYDIFNTTTLSDFGECITKPEKWTKSNCIAIPDNLECPARNVARRAFNEKIGPLLPTPSLPKNLDYASFFFGLIQLWIGIVIFKYLFAKISPIIVNLIGGSAASDIFTKGDGIFSGTKGDDGSTNSIGVATDEYQKGVDAAIKSGFGYDVNDKMFNNPLEKDKDGNNQKLFNIDESKSDLSKGYITNPFGLFDKKDEKKDEKKDDKTDDKTDANGKTTKPEDAKKDESKK